jgi:hypothetical protein
MLTTEKPDEDKGALFPDSLTNGEVSKNMHILVSVTR